LLASFDEKTKQWHGFEYLIDINNYVWSINYDEQELSIVKATPGVVVLEAGAMVRFLKMDLAEWLHQNRGIVSSEFTADTDIIHFQYA
jgi:hypothetical protein